LQRRREEEGEEGEEGCENRMEESKEKVCTFNRQESPEFEKEEENQLY